MLHFFGRVESEFVGAVKDLEKMNGINSVNTRDTVHRRYISTLWRSRKETDLLRVTHPSWK
jgi:hypothetical protein